MIIDTNGFEIGDEVWACEQYYGMPFAPIKTEILSFMIKKEAIYANTLLGFIHMSHIFKINNLTECQLACDKLNGINHD